MSRAPRTIASLLRQTAELWRPAEPVPSWDWMCRNLRAPDGQPFDAHNYPWGRGVCEAFDDPAIRTITLMWGSRLGKTFLGHGLMLYVAAVAPQPILFATSTQTLAQNIVREKLYKMLERCPALADQLRPLARRSLLRVDLRDSHWRIGWSGSDTSLADFDAWLVHANEVDKWTLAAKTEADPLAQALERAKNNPDSKRIIEGTPALRAMSRVNQSYEASDRRTFQVGCPHCRARQRIVMGSGDPREAGVVWDRGPDGRHDLDTAYHTAHYQCAACLGPWYDEDREQIIRGGVWLRHGESMTPDGEIVGTPERQGPDAGFQLSSLYSLRLRFGDVALQWIKSHKRPRERQNFVNSWLGEPYEPTGQTITPSELGARLATDVPRGVLPREAVFVTIGVDRQKTTHPYVVCAWWGLGGFEAGHVVDWGFCGELDDLLPLHARRWQSVASDFELGSSMTLIDSGYDPKPVYSLCERNTARDAILWPYKGASSELGGLPYKLFSLAERGLGRSRHTADASLRGRVLLHGNNRYWQAAIQRYLTAAAPWEPGGIGLAAEGASDDELLGQLANNQEFVSVTAAGITKIEWRKRQEDEADDLRDALKMARVAAEYRVRRNWASQAATVRSLVQPTATLPAPRATSGVEPPRSVDESDASKRPRIGRASGWVRRITPRKRGGR